MSRWLLTRTFYSIYEVYVAGFLHNCFLIRAFNRLQACRLAWNFKTPGDRCLVLKICVLFMHVLFITFCSGKWRVMKCCNNDFQKYRISWPIRRTVIFSLEILEKNNDECILILVIYWKKTGLLHTKISNHNIIYSP
jgi:hypothetical protein